MANPKFNTYKYQFKVGNKIVTRSFTAALRKIWNARNKNTNKTTLRATSNRWVA